MSPKENRNLPIQKSGIFYDIANRIKLIFRLVGDPRVNPLLKVLPVATLLYLVMPDIAPGPIDDAAVIWLGTTLFVELCPQDVVQEHMEAMEAVVSGEWRDPDGEINEEDVVDVEFKIHD